MFSFDDARANREMSINHNNGDGWRPARALADEALASFRLIRAAANADAVDCHGCGECAQVAVELMEPVVCAECGAWWSSRGERVGSNASPSLPDAEGSF